MFRCNSFTVFAVGGGGGRGVTIFLIWVFGGPIFFKPFMGEGHNFLAKLFLSLVALSPPPPPNK